MSDISLLHLPLHVLSEILKYLKTSDLRNLMLTCKSFKSLVEKENSIWKSNSKNKLIFNCKSDSLSYYNKCRISHNWCQGIYKEKIIIQHNTNYMPWLHFYKSEAIFLSVGSILNCYYIEKKGIPKCRILWSIVVPTIKRNDKRTNDISRFIIKDNLIVCGNRDGCTTVYSFNGLRQPQLLFHIEDCLENGLVEVSAVEKVDNLVVTASNDSSNISFCRISNLDNNAYKEIEDNFYVTLPNGLGCRSLAANNFEDKLALGINGNSKPLLLDVATSKFVINPNESKASMNVIRDIQWHDDNNLIYVTHTGQLQMMDIRTATLVYEAVDPFLSSIYCVKTDNNYAAVIGSSQFSRCALFDVRRNGHVQTYFTQKKNSPVYSLDFNTSRLVAAADRGVAVLNFNVNSASTRVRDYSHAFEIVRR